MAGSDILSKRWGSYQMLVNISEHKASLDAMMGFKETVTDHSTISVLQFMEYKSDNINYQNKYAEVMRDSKK